MRYLTIFSLITILSFGVVYAEDMVINPTTGELDVVYDKADEIDIDDAGDYYTGTEVETALQEIGIGSAIPWATPGTIGSTTPNTGDFTTLTVTTFSPTTLSVPGYAYLAYTSGNVGIGTSAPLGLLQVGTSPTPALIATKGGNVGIGTTNPLYRLDVGGSANVNQLKIGILPGMLKATAGTVGIGTSGTDYFNASVQIDHDATTNFVAVEHIDWTNATNNLLTTGTISGGNLSISGTSILTGNVGIGTTAPLGLLQVGTTNLASPGLLVTAGGFVGIGTTSPEDILHINGGGIWITGQNTSPALGLGSSGATYQIPYIYLQTPDNFWFLEGSDYNATEIPVGALGIGDYGGVRFTILNDGNVGIGTTAPTGLFVAGTSISTPSLFVSTGGNVGIGTTAVNRRLSVGGDMDVLGIIYANSVEQILSGGNIGVAGNLGVGTTAPELKIDVRGSGTSVFGFIGGNMGLGLTNPIYTLQVAGTTASGTLRFGAVYNNILPAGTGANNQILKTNASGVITWQNDNDTGASGVQSVSAALPLTSSGGTAPSIALTVDTGMFATGPSGELIIKNAGIDLASKTAGTLPAASMAIVNLAGGATIVSGTLPAANIAILPLSTHISGTLPDASSPLNIINTTITSGSGTFTALLVAGTNVGVNLNTAYTHSQNNTQAHTDYLLNNANDITSGILTAAGFLSTGNVGIGFTAPLGLLHIGTLPGTPSLFVSIGGYVGIGTTAPTQKLEVVGNIKTTQTEPIFTLFIQDQNASTDGIAKIIRANKKVHTITASLKGGSEVQYGLYVGTNNTTPISTLQTGTIPAGTITITNKGAAGDTIPSGSWLYINTLSVGTGVTNGMFGLQVDGADY